jgi:hypothetical protein
VLWELRHPGQLRFGFLLTFSFAIGEQWDETAYAANRKRVTGGRGQCFAPRA